MLGAHSATLTLGAVLVLAIDTSTPAVTAALARVDARADRAADARADRAADAGVGRVADADAGAGVDRAAEAGVAVLASRITVDARRHGELLAGSVAGVLAEGGCRAADLAAVVAGLGPGPYTGLRVGLVSAAAFADALHLPSYGVCSLDAVAAPVVGRVPVLLAATDARRREIYWAVYDQAGARLAGPDVDRPAVLARRLGELGVVGMCGAGARLYADVLGRPLLAADYPDPAGLVALAADRIRAGAGADPLTPLYLRRPDATEPARPKAVTPA